MSLLQGSDARDASLGRVFGLSSIIRSGRAKHDSALALNLASQLLSLQRSKSFLAEVSASSLLELLEQLDDATFASVLKAESHLRDLLQTSPEEASPEVSLSKPSLSIAK